MAEGSHSFDYVIVGAGSAGCVLAYPHPAFRGSLPASFARIGGPEASWVTPRETAAKTISGERNGVTSSDQARRKAAQMNARIKAGKNRDRKAAEPPQGRCQSKSA